MEEAEPSSAMEDVKPESQGEASSEDDEVGGAELSWEEHGKRRWRKMRVQHDKRWKELCKELPEVYHDCFGTHA